MIFIILVSVLIFLTVIQIILMIINLTKKPALITIRSKSKFNSISQAKIFNVGDILESPNKQYKLLLQPDGKLVLESKHGDIHWETNSSCPDANCKATFSTSGHLATWSKLNKEKLWGNTIDSNQGPYNLQLHDSGHLVVVDRNGKLAEQIFPSVNL